MDLDAIIAELKQRLDNVNQAIRALERLSGPSFVIAQEKATQNAPLEEANPEADT